jgi:hypothetical protein
MANPPQPSLGYAVSITPSNPPTEKSPIPPPPSISPTPPRFPLPKLQQDQSPSSIESSNVPSPANGVKSGSPIPHLSTPPGPPVFTSPVRPAAVPFRSSPASPQPVAFSSGSFLPMSSPPNLSNGSAELQQQISDGTENSVSARELPYVLFSAHKVSSILFCLVQKLRHRLHDQSYFFLSLYILIPVL